MRLFLAINLPEEARRALWALTRPVREAVGGVRWVDSAQLHLTLKFLGECDEASATPLADALRAVGARHGPIRASFAGIGAFPNLRRPRVVWIGVAGGEPIAAVAGDVDRECERLGFARETRPFTPHLTLGRVKEGLPARDADALQRAAERVTGRVQVTVGSVELMRSVLSSAGAKHSVVSSAALTGT